MKELNISVLTLFPDMFDSFLKRGIVSRSIDKGLLGVEIVNIRDSATDKHKTVDDMPYGGGAGMVMKVDVLTAALESTVLFRECQNTRVIYLTPQGKRFDQSEANRMSLMDGFVLVCGRYREIDERFMDMFVTDELSIGDYVLTGGEPAAMVVIDAVARLIPGAMGDFESGMEDSFQNGLLDCPWYTRPEEFRGHRVPDVLMSGNHAEIDKWRTEQSLMRTRERRPDLLESGNGDDGKKVNN